MLGLNHKIGFIVDGKSKLPRGKIAIVVAKFNEFVTKRLLDACLDELTKNGVKAKNIIVLWVPGAFEIPIVAKQIVEKKDVSGVICLGAVIRGETKHYDLVADNTARGIMDVALAVNKPIIFEVLAVDTMELAYKRSEEKGINKGRDAAQALLEVLDV
ncbi:MAG TPA: 6,7-dimethyl-8-ribityllumazine synthase, partial [Candidatus Omnitrophota bacterium]|nr:6,7-dimethyl-8-ribityllumazine synthase [Candidatus Omnitrophota bacterium]